MSRRWTALALAGALAGMLSLSGCGLVENAEAIVDRLTQTATGSEEQTDWEDLQVGDCIRESWDDELVSGLEVVDCTAEHTDELFAIVSHDGEFPGEDELLAAADDACALEFEPYVGVPFDESEYTYFALPPTEDNWRWGDRATLCFAYHIDLEPIVGSVQASEVES